MRIHVTGNAGAGKTTLARRLSADLDIPVRHVDTVLWKPGWSKVSREELAAALDEMTASEEWIIDGVAPVIRERADVVVYLSTPRWLCLCRVIKRCLSVGFRSRPENPGSPEIKILFRAIRIVWRFPGLVGKTIEEEARERDYIVTSDPVYAAREVSRRLQQTGRTPQPSRQPSCHHQTESKARG